MCSKVQFDGDAWKAVSSTAKEFILKLLKKDPRKRLTAHQVLQILSIYFWVYVNALEYELIVGSGYGGTSSFTMTPAQYLIYSNSGHRLVQVLYISFTAGIRVFIAILDASVILVNP